MKLAALTALVAVAAVHAAPTIYTETVNGVKWQYTLLGDEASIGANDEWGISGVKYESKPAISKKTKGVLKIPATLGGHPVTEICNSAFFECSEITSVIIPNGVTRIGEMAFLDCKKLKSVKIPDSVEYIDHEAFEHCKSITSLKIPTNVWYIGGAAFGSCTSLKSIVLHDRLTYMSGAVFSGCASLESISIPGSVKCIEELAFAMMPAWYLDLDVPNRYEIVTKLKKVKIAEGVVEIAQEAFTGCRKLRSITIPRSMLKIGSGAFRNCPQLASTIFKGNVEMYADSFEMHNYHGRVAQRSMFFLGDAPKVKIGYVNNILVEKPYKGSLVETFKNCTIYASYRSKGWNVKIPGKWHGLPIKYNMFNVAFYANGGKGRMAVQKMTYGKAKKLAANKFKRTGYVFKGWAKSKKLAKKGKVSFGNKRKVKNLNATGKTVKLYAVWKKK